jgi:hypothetical protein
MCCGTSSHHMSWHCGPYVSGHHHVGHCSCGTPFHLGHICCTKEQQVAWLERYVEGLQAQVKAIEERIAELKEEE